MKKIIYSLIVIVFFSKYLFADNNILQSADNKQIKSFDKLNMSTANATLHTDHHSWVWVWLGVAGLYWVSDYPKEVGSLLGIACIPSYLEIDDPNSPSNFKDNPYLFLNQKKQNFVITVALASYNLLLAQEGQRNWNFLGNVLVIMGSNYLAQEWYPLEELSTSTTKLSVKYYPSGICMSYQFD